MSLASCGGRVEGIAEDAGTGTSPTATPTATSIPPPPPSPPRPPPPEDAGALDGGICGNASLPPDDVCTRYVQLPCALPKDAGTFGQEECKKHCPESDAGQGAFFCAVQSDPANGDSFLACNYCVVGRRPEGLAAQAPAAGDVLGVFLAGASRLEAASVDAFRTLERELHAHGAPGELCARAARAARDEVRHARATAKLARRFGAQPGTWSDPPRVDPPEERSLEAMAIENVIEGCVRETFGALVGMWQAERAAEPAIRRAMRGIARDETRHAALAWAVATWLDGTLDADARTRVATAKREAIAQLTADLAHEPASELRARAGLPDAREAASLVDALRADLWAA